MIRKSRKKNNDFKGKMSGEQNALQHYDDTNRTADEFIIKDLGVNKKKKNNVIKKINVKKIAVISVAFLVLLTLVFTIRFIRFNAVEMVWKTSVTRGSDAVNNKSVRYYAFRNGLMRISNDGITYINDIGEVVYTISYNMKDPIYESNDKYFAIADRNGYEFFIFDDKGLSGNNLVSNPIQKISLSIDGVIYILQSDEDNSYVNLFRHKGEEIDIAIKTTLSSDGMPIDISTSRDGTQLIMAYTCLSNNDIYSKATYYNFAEAGANANSKRIVGEFVEQLKDKFLARVHYFDDRMSCLIYDDGIYFVTTANPSKPSIVNQYTFNNKIRSISYNRDYIVYVFENNQFKIFDKNGKLLGDSFIDFEYDNFYLSDNLVVFLYGNRIIIYDSMGRMIFDREMDLDVQYVAKKKSLLFTELLIGLIDGVECIKFY